MAIVAGLVVCAREGKHRVEQTCLLQSEEDWIGAARGAESAVAELYVGASGVFIFFEKTDGIALRLATTFEYAKDIAGLRGFPPLQRLEVGKDALILSFFVGWRWPGLQTLWFAVAPVTLAEVRVLVRPGAIVVEGGSPEHGAMRHHAHPNLLDFFHVTSRRAAGLVGNAEIARIHETDVL